MRQTILASFAAFCLAVGVGMWVIESNGYRPAIEAALTQKAAAEPQIASAQSSEKDDGLGALQKGLASSGAKPRPLGNGFKAVPFADDLNALLEMWGESWWARIEHSWVIVSILAFAASRGSVVAG